jgi:hypothetical protein
VRVVLFLALALIASSAGTTTSAYFTSISSATGNNLGTVRLDLATAPSVSDVLNVAANMLPGDFQIRTFDVANTGSVGVAQQAFSYSVSSTSTGVGNMCSLLDASDPPTCSTPAVPSAAADTGAALLLLRCSADAAVTTPLACDTANVYVTQVYPAAGAGTQRQITSAGGLTRTAIQGVATGGAYTISIAGTAFTGGQLVIGSAYGMGGPDSVAGADGQTQGLAGGTTDHFASVVYLPSQAGDSLADQISMLTFTWTANQKVGGLR